MSFKFFINLFLKVKLLEDARGKILNVEKLINSIEASSLNKQIFDSMEQGAEALEKINREIDLEVSKHWVDNNLDSVAFQRVFYKS